MVSASVIHPLWKLKIIDRGRWHSLRSMVGWHYEWEVRKWCDGSIDTEGYYPPGLFGWHGSSRSLDKARDAAEGAYDYFRVPKADPLAEIWYHDD